MSEIGRDHFLVATYEHMSLNATPTLVSVTLPLLPVGLQENYCCELLDRKRGNGGGGMGGWNGAVKKEIVGGFSTELSFLALL